MASEPDFLACRDEPFRRVILIPFNRVTVIHRELMMKVVITFTDSDQCGDKMVAGRVLIVKGCISQPMCKRVNAERRLERVR
jgi:hypothetical protein